MFPLLPLRIPVDCDLVLQLSNWIDARHENALNIQMHMANDPSSSSSTDNAATNGMSSSSSSSLVLPPTVAECQPDLVRLQELRQTVARVMMQHLHLVTTSSSSSSNHQHHRHHHAKKSSAEQENDDAQQQQKQHGNEMIMVILKEYASMLNAFCQKGGFPDVKTVDHHQQGGKMNHDDNEHHHHQHNGQPLLELPWKINNIDNDNNNNNHPTTAVVVVGSSLTWEQANVYWNLAALTVVQAKSLHPATTKPAWNEMSKLLPTAASWIQHVRVHLYSNHHHHHQSTTTTTTKQETPSDESGSEDDDDDDINDNDTCCGGDDFWLSSRVLRVIESFLAAASQVAAFKFFQVSKSAPLISAKVAAAAIPFYAMAEEDAQRAVAFLQQQQQQQNHEQTINHNHNHNNNTVLVANVLSQWADALRAWGMWMSAMAEYHQALVHEGKIKSAASTTTATAAANNNNKKAVPLSAQQRKQQLAQHEEHLCLELARLDIANRFGTLCYENLKEYYAMTENNNTNNKNGGGASSSLSLESRFLLGTLVEQVQVVLPQIRAQQLHAKQEDHRFAAENNNRTLAIPSHEDLPEIPPQTTVKFNSNPAAIAKLLPPLPNDLFKTTLDEAARRILLDTRLDWEDEWLPALEQAAEDLTEQGRRTLASVNLPHSLTAYRQERAGGGIPQDLWLRVEQLQKENRITRLQQELWDLKDVADQASVLYKGIQSQLQDDLTMDQLFREQNPTFEGHDVEEIQKTFRLTLDNYAHLMESAEKGDALLFKRLELLNTDPKYRLLQFRKSQLDRLIPPVNNNTTTQQDINVEELSRYLVELSSLFQQRDDLLDDLRNQIRTTHAGLVGQMIQALQQQQQQQPPQQQQQKQKQDQNQQTEELYHRIVASARRSLEQDMVQGLQDNMNAQSDILKRILEENAYFCRARGGTSAAAAAMPASPSNPGDRSILKIEDALEEIDQLDKHLKEGRAFYNVVIPKLEKLQQQVGDVSARLTIDRCDFDDRARRTYQEAEDARMAASMNSNNNSSATGGGSPPSPPSGYCNEPSAAAVSQNNDQQRRSSNSSNVDAGGSMSSGSHSGNTGSGGGGGARTSLPSSAHQPPGIRVDDEKVASLVAMDFDPDRVVAALKKHDNNVEQAINELLSG